MNGISITSEQLGQLLWTASWQAAVLAVFVAVVCHLLRRQIKPAWQFALWSLVFVRLACPALPSSMFSVQNLIAQSEGPAPATISTPAAPEHSSIDPATGQGNEIRSSDEFPVNDSTRRPAPELTATVSRSPKASTSAASSFAFSIRSSVLVLWGTIASLLLIRQLILWRTLICLSTQWQAITDPQTLAVLDECLRSMRLRRPVRLLQADGPVGPAVLGVWQPRIVLPAEVPAAVSEYQLRMLLLHELQHVRRWDVLWDRLATLLVIVHWFNPAAWWARKCLADAREQACDAAVLRQLGANQAKPYGHLVMTLAERQQHRTADPVLVGMLGRSHSLSRRIEGIAGYRPSSMRHVVIGLALMVTLIAGGLTGAQQPQANSSPQENNRPETAVNDDPAQPGQRDYALSGVCRDADDKPLAGVRVRLFRVSKQNTTRELVKEIQTETDGTFRFDHLPSPRLVEFNYGGSYGFPFFEPYYMVAAGKPGYASALVDHRFPEQVKDPISIKMPEAGKLTGRVSDPQGNPIAGADVFVQSYPYYDPIENLMSAKTDSDGRYVLDDLPLREADGETTTDAEGNTYGAVSTVLFRVTHPDYGRVHPFYSFIPSQVDVTLEPAARAEGIVTDAVTGKPASGVRVELRGVHPTNDWNSTTTDEQGRYSFPNLSQGQYNIWAEAPDRTCIAIASLQVEAGTTYDSQNLELIEGSWIRGKIVDDATGNPVTEIDGRPVLIRGHGPSHPEPGATYGAPVDENGEFQVRVAPGSNNLHTFPSTSGKWVFDRDKYGGGRGFEVGESEIVPVEFRVERVRRARPKASPKPAPSKDTDDLPDAGATESGTTGTFSGRIRFEGKVPVLPPLVEGEDIPDESLVVNPKNLGIANVFVYLDRAPENAPANNQQLNPVVLTCRKGRFDPHAQVIQIGQMLQIDNKDKGAHNIHISPFRNLPVNILVLPKNNIEHNYTRAERVPIKIQSDLQPWMSAWHLPLDHPYAAVTDEDGRFIIRNLPSGTHKFRIWHEKAGLLEREYEITIEANKQTQAALQYPAARFE